MNAVARPVEFVPADEQGGGLLVEEPRHRFTVDDMWALVRSGVISSDARIELVEGVSYDMASDGRLHLTWSAQLNWRRTGALGRTYAILANATLRLADLHGPSPDWFVHDPRLHPADVGGGDALLVMEQSDTSLSYDLRGKARLYALHGVRDYWVIDLEAERVHVHRAPGPEGYGSVEVFERDQLVEALLIPGLALRLADLPRVG